MTPGANSPAQTDQDCAFSERLRAHARSLDLSETMPVGAWSFGQGIRRAEGERFFWQLSSRAFQPLGLNHPLALKEPLALPGPQKFPAATCQLFPALSAWSWSLVSPQDAWLKNRAWTRASAWQLAHGPWLSEDATFKGQLGWQGFSELDQLQGWAVELDEQTTWIASPTALPTPLLSHWARCVSVLLTPDVLGPHGRIQELNQKLRGEFRAESVQGLNVRVAGSHPAIARDAEGLCFPLSFLPSEPSQVAVLLGTKGSPC